MTYSDNESESYVDMSAENTAGQYGATSFPTKVFRAFVAIIALGSVAAYGAISVKPELVDYLSFVPGLEASNAGMCNTAACCSSAAVSVPGCGEACDACPSEVAATETVDFCDSATCPLCPDAACPSSDCAASSMEKAEDCAADTEVAKAEVAATN